MTQHINLITAALLPRPQRLAPKPLLALLGGVALLVLTHFAWERVALTQTLARADSPPPVVNAEAGASVGDPVLRERITRGEALREVLRKQGVVAEGSARILREIFDALPDEVWLTEVELGAERALRIGGGATDGTSFARFAQRLAAVASLQGLPVTTVRLHAPTRSEANAGAPADPTAAATQLFVLASAPEGAAVEPEPQPPAAQATR
jgi:hypothetical protein